MVYYDLTTGRPETVMPTLRRRVSAFTRHDRVRVFKIGITANPERRFREAYANRFHEMRVLYQTTSRRNICAIESDLIEHNWVVCDNRIGGGGGRSSAGPLYYLYVVRDLR